MVKAKYIRHPNSALRGNPLIEGLGYPLSRTQLHECCNRSFVRDLDLNEVPVELHGYYIRSLLNNLLDVHICQDEMIEVYETIRQSIEVGYRKRNPLDPDHQRLLAAIERDKDSPLKAQNIKRLNLLGDSFSYLLCGLSGRGKTSMIHIALNHIDQVIEHDEYVDLDNNTVALSFTQVTYVYIQHHDRRGQKALLISILEAIDEETNEGYAYGNRNSSVKDLINSVRKAVILHGIATIIIDEAQNFASSPKDVKIGTNEKTSMKFVEEIFNTIGASLIFVGTFSTLELFSKEVTITRRTIRHGSMTLASCDVEGSFWKRLCNEILVTDLLAGASDDHVSLRQHVHYLSAGIPAIAVSLVNSTLSYLTYNTPENQTLTISALDYVFDKQFSLLREPIRALHEGNYHQFEDLKPMLLLEKANPKNKTEEQIRGIQVQAQEMEARLHQKQTNLLSGFVQMPSAEKPTPKYEVDATKESEALSPTNFISLLGGNS
ncbi:ATP-binding protein [Vibrio sp. 404]|uniref:ATP-binding protein n=1 Tax=Vibrio marinisediminis TaxID=2758441 RepID=A0A7W2IRZ2_9VIBR|nr:ATP-binding protein [Vibrio marinisediminis]MBA5760941.1 ATP-binding protein [Vibrio marinisediminis]